MPSSFRDPKTLADWIQLDYFRKPRRFWRVRNVLTWSVFIACLATMAFTWWPRIRFIYESRPVSSAHAMFNNNCGVCHIEAFQPALRLVRGDSSLRSVPDDRCRECHNVGAHQDHVSEPNCSTCHQEHRGRPVLARVADSYCTACHADLNRIGSSQTRFAKKINGFPTDHPHFGAWQGERLVDHGTIRFNHNVHLNLNPESVRRIDKPLAALREQQCHYCHKPDAAGRYMEPINYDRHCSQCHALSVGVAGSWSGQQVQAAAEHFALEPAPHKDPATVRAAMRERFTRFVLDNPAVLGTQESTEPPRWLLGASRAQIVTDKEWLWVNEQLQQAERVVFDGANGCSYCHKVEVGHRPGSLPQYSPSRITAHWLVHSIFSHERHQMLGCTECHDARTSSDTKDVLLPTIKSCRQCHNSQVGARIDCSECHRYHDRARGVFLGKKSILECTLKQ